MESSLLRQIRVLQILVLFLVVVTSTLVVDLFHPLLPVRHFKVIEVQKVNIREASGILKASLSNSEGFKVFGRAKQDVSFSGLMFYNEEGDEAGGLVYDGKAISGGQQASLALTFDQFRQDQNIYLHHDEYKDAKGSTISDGLAVNARPDFTAAKEEYQIYDRLQKMPPEQRDDAKLTALQQGKIGSRRVFLGVQRGFRNDAPYDDSGVFIKNKWGQNAIKLYVDNDNKPHFEIYDPKGKTILYELRIPKS
jgi:hypothetical protein